MKNLKTPALEVLSAIPSDEIGKVLVLQDTIE